MFVLISCLDKQNFQVIHDIKYQENIKPCGEFTRIQAPIHLCTSPKESAQRVTPEKGNKLYVLSYLHHNLFPAPDNIC